MPKSSEERVRHMDAARVRAELTVQGLWLRYIALGGTGDAFDLDGYLQFFTQPDLAVRDAARDLVRDALTRSVLT